MPDYDPLRSYMHNWFLGFHVKQYFVEFLVWEKFFLQCGPLRRIVELGSGMGGFSFYLFLQAKKRVSQFDTWDIAPVHVATTKLGKDFGFDKCCHTGDVLNDETIIEVIQSIISKPGKTLLFCDNGHKPMEVNLYAPHLKVGDYLAVHDWEHEIFPHHFDHLSLKEFPIEEIEQVSSWTRFFEVVDV